MAAVYIVSNGSMSDSCHRVTATVTLPRAPTMVPDNAPSKASLLKWWSQFTHAQKSNKFPEYNQRACHPVLAACPHPHTASAPEHHPVFSKPLKDSLRRASVQISTANANGDLYVWGYIPVVVAKWSVSDPSPSRPTHSPQRSPSQRKRYISPFLNPPSLMPPSYRDRRHLPCKRLR